MEPIVIFPNAASLRRGEMEFDCDCACTLPVRGPRPDHQPLPEDAWLQTCQPFYQQTLTAEFELILSPASQTTLAVVNAPARRVLNFFNQGGTVAELIAAGDLPETTCRQTAAALWQAGFLALATNQIL